MPVSVPVRGHGSVGTWAQAQQEQEAYQPSASWLIVTGLGVPCSGRDDAEREDARSWRG
jgi:hypothetical protein